MQIQSIGIVQGRLTPPQNNHIQCFPLGQWANEFLLASKAGLECIEWIYDVYGMKENPICSDSGIQEILRLSEKHRVKIKSLCADYFMEHLLTHKNDELRENNIQHLNWLILQCSKLNIQRIVLPFVDNSSLKSLKNLSSIVKTIRNAADLCKINNMELHIESDFNPEEFLTFMNTISHSCVKINYDSGNSSGLGYHPKEEFKAYGKFVGSVHIKDRMFKGTTVPLGTGSANFGELITALRQNEYNGDFILQVARGETGSELEWAIQNKAKLLQILG